MINNFIMSKRRGDNIITVSVLLYNIINIVKINNCS